MGGLWGGCGGGCGGGLWGGGCGGGLWGGVVGGLWEVVAVGERIGEEIKERSRKDKLTD